MKRSSRNTKRLQVEQLESRTMLAGNVTAHVAGGTLTIHGDDFNNTISVESFPGGAVQVRGFDDFLGFPTAVNGAPNGVRLFYGVGNDIIIHMKGGDDTVRVSNLVVGRHLTIDMGSGRDELVTGRDEITGPTRFAGTPAGPLYVSGEMKIHMGTEDDYLFQSDVHVWGKTTIDLGAGNDIMVGARPAGSGANIEYFSDLVILPKEGDDNIYIDGLVSRGVTINNEFGRMDARINSADVYGKLSIESRQFNDIVSITATNVRGEVHTNLREGHDLFNFFGIASKITLHTGSGNDYVAITNSAVDEIAADLGSGDDFLLMLNVWSRLVYINAGDGADRLEVNNLRADQATFDGGKGFDVYREPIVPPNQIRRFHLHNIERIETF
jgi:hypothetical protein